MAETRSYKSGNFFQDVENCMFESRGLGASEKEENKEMEAAAEKLSNQVPHIVRYDT